MAGQNTSGRPDSASFGLADQRGSARTSRPSTLATAKTVRSKTMQKHAQEVISKTRQKKQENSIPVVSIFTIPFPKFF
jgi:hypothetical protein